MDAMAESAEDLGQHRPELSAWSVGQHLDHMALSGLSISSEMGKMLADPASGRPRKWTASGHLCLTTGWIPRGKGKAPDFSRPAEVDQQKLVGKLAELRVQMELLGGRLDEIRASLAGFRHPAFGVLSLSDWVRLIRIHDHHHLKIVAEIRSL